MNNYNKVNIFVYKCVSTKYKVEETEKLKEVIEEINCLLKDMEKGAGKMIFYRLQTTQRFPQIITITPDIYDNDNICIVTYDNHRLCTYEYMDLLLKVLSKKTRLENNYELKCQNYELETNTKEEIEKLYSITSNNKCRI